MIDIMSFNFEVKLAGKHVTLKKYSKTNQFNYAVKNSGAKAPRGQSEMKKENFIKSITRARKKVFDIIACNVNCIPDYNGDIQRPKFLTLTFAENITDLKTANAEFTKFNKRLSYYLYSTHKNVLKYICIPEFQKRGAVHYHVLYFNLPYVEYKELNRIWGQGYTFIEGIKDKSDVEDFAKYVSKYINKENSAGEDNYSLYEEKDLLNQKRYFASRGLNKPSVYKLNVDKELYQTFLAMLSEFHSNNHEFENEFIGKMEINNYEIENTSAMDRIKNAISTIYKIMHSVYDKTVKIRYRDVEKYIRPETYYAILNIKMKAMEWLEKQGGITCSH